MDRFKIFWIRVVAASRVTARFLLDVNNFVQTAAIFVAILVLLQWLFSLEQFIEIVQTAGFGPLDFIEFIVESFIRIFAFISDLTPISFIGIAGFQAVSLRMLIEIRRSKQLKGSVGSMVVGLVGSGCVACGGSIVSPFLSLAAVNISVSFAERIGDLVLLIALFLAFYSWQKVALMCLTAFPPEFKEVM